MTYYVLGSKIKRPNKEQKPLNRMTRFCFTRPIKFEFSITSTSTRDLYMYPTFSVTLEQWDRFKRLSGGVLYKYIKYDPNI